MAQRPSFIRNWSEIERAEPHLHPHTKEPMLRAAPFSHRFELRRLGIAVGSHGHKHFPWTSLSDADKRQDLADARGVANLGLNLRTSAFVRRASDAELLRLLRDGRAIRRGCASSSRSWVAGVRPGERWSRRRASVGWAGSRRARAW